MSGIQLSVLICVVLHGASSEFFHEKTMTLLHPREHDSHLTSQFGFSMGYQGSDPPKLVVGAPMYDFIGKVFSCPLSELNGDVVCNELNMTGLDIETKTAASRKKIDPNLYYRFGASIAATPDYSLTCAPMLPRKLEKAPAMNEYGQIKVTTPGPAVIGACYLNKTANGFLEWKDQSTNLIYEAERIRKNSKHNKTNNFLFKSVLGGGLGWQTLVDVENKTLIVAKPTFPYGLLYVQASPNKLENVISHSVKEFSTFPLEFDDFYNIGYGMAAGRFFNKSEILYAVTTGSSIYGGRIIFLKWYTIENNTKLDLLESSYHNSMAIKYNHISSMFGYSLAANDLTLDGFSDLIVGVPAKVDKGREVGAVIIYFGRNLEADRLDNIHNVMIIGMDEDGRFGHAIASSDIDSDGIPEIFVSTTKSKVFVLSGYELQKRLYHTNNKQMYLSELTLTQTLEGEDGGFGFSLQVVKDIDGNGCDELAVGSPSKSEVKLYRCLPAVSAAVSLPSGNQTINPNATDFEVKVCHDIIIGQTCKSSLDGNILVNIKVTESNLGNVTDFADTLELKNVSQSCKIYNVSIKPSMSATYFVTTTLSMSDKENESRYKFWAVLSHWSETKASITVSQYCTGSDCESSVVYGMVWQDVSRIEIDTSLGSYTEAAVITVNNTGQPVTSDTTLTITVDGAESSMNNDKCSKKENNKYICRLDVVQHNIPYTFIVSLDTNNPYNVPAVTVSAQLQDLIHPDRYEPLPMITKPYKFDLSQVSLTGLSHDFKITDEDMADENIDKFTDNHEYIILNNGPVTWRNLTFRLEITKEPFIQKDDIPIVYPSSCSKDSTADKFVYECPLTLKARESVTIAASLAISKKELENLIAERNTSIRTQLSFSLDPTTEVRNVSILTQLHYNKILSVGNNQTLIIVLVVSVALLLLFILSLILYKIGFFKRDKKKLTELRASVRKRSVRMQSESNSRSARPSAAGEDNCDIEVVEDPFDDVAITPETDPQPKDDVELIKESPSSSETK